MRRHLARSIRIGILGILVTWGLGGLFGCTSDKSLLSPGAGAGDGTPESLHRAQGDLSPATRVSSVDVDWTVVGTSLVLPGTKSLVTGSRYELEFPVGSLTVPMLITISEHDSLVADVEFGPDGAEFGQPVQVTIDYRDTAVDPESKHYRGISPGAFYFNPQLNRWEPLPCVVDTEARTVTFKVSHFSRYGLTDAALAGEWQWNRGGRPGNRVSHDEGY